MANWGANHGALSYGHIGADLVTLASLLRIPVCMHNLDERHCSARAPGAPSAPRIPPARITAPAQPLARCMAKPESSMTAPSFLAVDLGAESGRASWKIYKRLTMEEIHRFLQRTRAHWGPYPLGYPAPVGRDSKLSAPRRKLDPPHFSPGSDWIPGGWISACWTC